jgi:hypothetical protein
MAKRINSFVWMWASFLVVVFLVGCAGNSDLVKAGFFKVGASSPTGIKITGTKVHNDDGTLVVSGRLMRTYRAKSYPGHVDIAIVAPDGRIVDQASVKNKLPFVGRSKRKNSSFKARFATVPPEGSTIHVIFHRKGSPETTLFDCGSNIAIPGN